MPKIFITYKPNQLWLRKYISYYYFHQNSNRGEVDQFIYYSNVENALTIYKNSIIDLTKEKLSTTYPFENKDFYTYSGILEDYCVVKLIAPYDKIGVVFKPLGLHYFVKDSVDSILNLTNNDRSEYFQNLLNLDSNYLFDNTIENRIDKLDNIFSELFFQFDDVQFIQIIEEIYQNTEEINIEKLANKFEISTKTLQRKFQKHFSITPKKYLKIVKFRKAFNHYMKENKEINFTDLSYLHNYYDQSEFIHHFKSITGNSPKNIFKNIDRITDEDIYWNFKI